MAVLEGVAMWASIISPNDKFEPVYTINVVIDDKEAKEFASKGHKIKETEMGPSVVVRRKVQDNKGNSRPIPKLVDRDKQPLTEYVGNGSKVKVQYHEWETTNSFGSFKGLDLQAVQVLDLVVYNPGPIDGDEFGLTEEDEF